MKSAADQDRLPLGTFGPRIAERLDALAESLPGLALLATDRVGDMLHPGPRGLDQVIQTPFSPAEFRRRLVDGHLLWIKQTVDAELLAQRLTRLGLQPDRQYTGEGKRK